MGDPHGAWGLGRCKVPGAARWAEASGLAVVGAAVAGRTSMGGVVR